MDSVEGPEERLRARLREELDKLPLSAIQKAAVLPALVKRARYLDTRGGLRAPGRLQSRSGYFDFAPKIEAMVHRFEHHGLTTKAYLHAALKQPQLLAQKTETIAANVDRVTARFAANGLTTQAYLNAALRHPPLFYQKPERVGGNIAGVVNLLGSYGLTTEAYLRSALRYPTLFSRQPESVVANLESFVRHFAADGLSTTEYVRAALIGPQLFAQSPRTLIRHAEAIIRLAEIGVFSPPRIRMKEPGQPITLREAVVTFLMSNSGCLCMSDANIALREVYQRVTNCPPNARVLLMPRYVVERELACHSVQFGQARKT